MADLKHVKKALHAHWPERTILSNPGAQRFEKLLTPKLLKSRFFKGLPLTSPLTGEKIDASDMRDAIQRAINIIETETRCDVIPTIKRHRLHFDANLYEAFIHLEIPLKPIQEVLSITISAASYINNGGLSDTPPTIENTFNPYNPRETNPKYPNGDVLYKLPNEWVDMANAVRGILNINPFSPAFTAVGVATTPSASPLMAFLGQLRFVPGFWNIECVTGLGCLDGTVPVFVNEMIGAKAASLILDNLIPLFQIASQSLSTDGLSQSVSNLAYQLLKQKRDDLEITYTKYVNLLKSITANRMFASNV